MQVLFTGFIEFTQGCREGGGQRGMLPRGPALWEGPGSTCDINEVGITVAYTCEKRSFIIFWDFGVNDKRRSSENFTGKVNIFAYMTKKI